MGSRFGESFLALYTGLVVGEPDSDPNVDRE
jgi:hypothetical protein